jgi:hypothetical protein
MSFVHDLFEFPIEVAEMVAKGMRVGGSTVGGVAYVLGELAVTALESARAEAHR